MASKLVFTVLTILAAVATAADVTDFCRVGSMVGYDPLRPCREFIIHRCDAAARSPEYGETMPGWIASRLAEAKARCCVELGGMMDPCRCDALSIMVNGVITEEGVRVGRMEAVPGCTRERIAEMAAALPTPVECNVQTESKAPAAICPLWGGGMD